MFYRISVTELFRPLSGLRQNTNTHTPSHSMITKLVPITESYRQLAWLHTCVVNVFNVHIE